MLELAQKIFGSLAPQYLPKLDRVISSLKGTRYIFEDLEVSKKILNTDLSEGMRIYWSEILTRSHIAAASSILRGRCWIEGVIDAYRASNILSFAACMRGFLESAADSHDALYRVPKTLARDHKRIQEALDSRMNQVCLNPELEDMLIHFTHAHKPQNIKAVPKTHQAKSIRDYLTILDKSEVPQVFECYSFLCDLTHPGASSVWTWFDSENDSEFNLTPSTSSLVISEFCSQYQEIMLPLFMYSFNTGILILAVLNHFTMQEFHCSEVSKWNLDGIKAWQQIQSYLMN